MSKMFVHVGDATWIEHLHPRAPSGQFAISTGAGAAQQRKAQLTESHEHFHPHLPPELHGPPKPGEPFLILRLGRAGHESLTERDAGNSYGVAEHLANVDDFEQPQGSGGTGDHINLYRVVTKHEAGPYEHLIDKHGGAYGQGVGYREHGKKGTPCAISISFSQGGYDAELLASIPLDHFRKRLKTHGYENFDDAGWKIGGDVIREVVGHHMTRQYGKRATSDEWVESKHPRGGHPENKGEFSKGSGSGSTVHVHVHRNPSAGSIPDIRRPGPQQGSALYAQQYTGENLEQSLYDDVDFDPQRAKLYDPAPRKSRGGHPENVGRYSKPLDIPTPGGVTFASPNIHELPKMTAAHAIATAQAQLASKRQKLFEQASADVDQKLGLRGQTLPAIGAWMDGAEGTTVFTAPTASAGQLKLSAAMKGYLGQQKAVLSFESDPKGPDVLYTGYMTGEPEDIHRALIAAGIENHTLVPSGTGVTIHIADQDGAAAKAVSKFAMGRKLNFRTTRGRADFIGAKHYEGTTDAQQRAEAQQEYEYVIAHSGVAGSSGMPAGEIWRGIRDRWAQALLTTQDRGSVRDRQVNVFVEAQHPRKGSGPAGGQFTAKGTGGASSGARPFLRYVGTFR